MDIEENSNVGTMKPVTNINEDDVLSKKVNSTFEKLNLSNNDEESNDKNEEKVMEENGIILHDFVFFEKEDLITESKKSIDDDIKEDIQKLNEKGYITKYSCSGHPSGRFKKDKYKDGVLYKKLYSTARIVFKEKYDFYNIPKYWEMKVLDEDKVAIYVKAPNFKIEDGLPIEAFNKWKAKYMNSLHKWVDKLPKNGEQHSSSNSKVSLESVIDDLIIDSL